MPCRSPLLPALIMAALCYAVPAHASDTCARANPGKCKAGQISPPRKASPGAVTRHAVQPPPRGNHKGRDQYTEAQRETFMESARWLCRKKYGAPSTVYRVDYKRLEVWCDPPAY